MTKTTTPFRRGVLLLLAALVLAACSSLGGLAGPRTVSISTAQMQAALAKRFPLDGAASNLLGFKLQSPRLYMLPEQNRIGAELRISLQPSFSLDNSSAALVGVINLDSALRFEKNDATVRLVNPRINTLSFGNAGSSNTGERQRLLQRVGQELLAKALHDQPLYVVQADDLRRNGVVWTPGEFRVTASGLELTLTPQ